MLHSITRGARSATKALTIASVPASHVYVRHLAPVDAQVTAVDRLADPPPSRPAADGQWWPPAMLDPTWVETHAAEFDIFHIHFGFDAWAPAELVEIVAALRTAERPIVFTVHDLRNPHHLERGLHDQQLDVLVPAADRLITLTQGAALEIRRRWGRSATVIPHPHVVELATAARVRRDRAGRSGPFRVGVHLKSLRACMDHQVVLPGLVRAVSAIPGAVLQVNGHRDVLSPDGRRFDASLADLLAELGPSVELHVHDFFSDAELWDYLGRLDVSVLPYRFGTHSGWLEACRDLGTAVVAPTCGYYADQGPVHSYVLDELTFDERSLVDAVRAAHDSPAPVVDLAARRRQRDQIAAAHYAVYASLVS